MMQIYDIKRLIEEKYPGYFQYVNQKYAIIFRETDDLLTGCLVDDEAVGITFHDQPDVEVYVSLLKSVGMKDYVIPLIPTTEGSISLRMILKEAPCETVDENWFRIEDDRTTQNMKELQAFLNENNLA